MVESIVKSYQVVFFAVAVFGLGYLCGLVRGKYGNPQNALRAMKLWVKEKTRKIGR